MNAQTVIIPSRCLGCGAERAGVQHGDTAYECGTRMREEHGRIVVMRSSSCERKVVARLVIPLDRY